MQPKRNKRKRTSNIKVSKIFVNAERKWSHRCTNRLLDYSPSTSITISLQLRRRGILIQISIIWFCVCRANSEPGPTADLWHRRPGLPVPGELRVQEVLGRAELRHHQLRQHRLRHVDSVPVHHHGGLDWRHVLDQWRNRGHIHLALLRASHHPRLLLHAQSSPWCTFRVSASTVLLYI